MSSNWIRFGNRHWWANRLWMHNKKYVTNFMINWQQWRIELLLMKFFFVFCLVYSTNHFDHIHSSKIKIKQKKSDKHIFIFTCQVVNKYEREKKFMCSLTRLLNSSVEICYTVRYVSIYCNNIISSTRIEKKKWNDLKKQLLTKDQSFFFQNLHSFWFEHWMPCRHHPMMEFCSIYYLHDRVVHLNETILENQIIKFNERFYIELD